MAQKVGKHVTMPDNLELKSWNLHRGKKERLCL